MAYTPGTLHIDGRALSGAAVPTGRYRITCEQADLIKDPTDGTKVFVGPFTGQLVSGAASIALPPSTGMDPNPVTYKVELWLDNYADIEPITGVAITASTIAEYATLVSVVPVAGQPNFAILMAGYVSAAAASAAAAQASQVAAAASAAAVVGDLGTAVNLGNVSGTIDLSAYVLGSQVFRMVATGNLTIDVTKLPAPPAGLVGSCSLRITQDAGPARTLTLPAAVLTSFGLDPVLSTAVGAIDLLHFLWDGVAWECYVGGQALA